MLNHTYIPWSEIMLVEADENELNQIISSLDKLSTLKFLTDINNFLALFPPSHDRNKFEYIQKILIANFLSEVALNEYNSKFASKGISTYERPVFHRQQILCLMKKVLLYSSDEGGENLNNNNETKYLLGNACLQMNEFLVPVEETEPVKNDEFRIELEHNNVLNEMLAQMISVTELNNPPKINRSIARTIEYLRLSDEILPDFYNGQTLSQTFNSLNGISLLRFLQMVYGICAWYELQDVEDLIKNPANFNLRKSTWFSKLNFTNEEIDSFYELTAIKLQDLELAIKEEITNKTLKPQYNFTTFRTFPLLNLTEDTFTSVDVSFLVEKASFGLFHTILNSLKKHFPEDKRLRSKFMAHWGDVFEHYVNNYLRAIYPKFSGRFFPDTEFESKTTWKAFDGIIDYTDSLLVMEYKSGTMKVDAKYSGNPKLLLEEMNKKYGRAGEGISQIATNIEVLFNSIPENRRNIKGVLFNNARGIFPILIVNELSFKFGLSNWKLWTWFKEEIDTKSINRLISVNPLLTLTIEDLENILPYIEEGDFTLLDFVSYYSNFLNIRRDWRLANLERSDEYHPMVGVGNIISNFLQERKIDFRNNERLQKKWKEFFTEIMSLFKDDS